MKIWSLKFPNFENTPGRKLPRKSPLVIHIKRSDFKLKPNSHLSRKVQNLIIFLVKQFKILFANVYLILFTIDFKFGPFYNWLEILWCDALTYGFAEKGEDFIHFLK